MVWLLVLVLTIVACLLVFAIQDCITDKCPVRRVPFQRGYPGTLPLHPLMPAQDYERAVILHPPDDSAIREAGYPGFVGTDYVAPCFLTRNVPVA